MGRRRLRGHRGDAVGALPEAIAALSQTLPAGPSPEIFRRAKFDRPEAAPALWQLLFRVLSPLPADGASASPASPTSPALEAQVHLVKSALRSQGYPRRALAQLPEDGSQGSRELLLALAWLLARGPLLEQLLAQTRVRLGDEIPLCECEALASAGPLPPRQEADGPVDIRHLQWLMGKLRFQWRNLITSQQEQCALLGKIHSYTRGCHSDRSLGHLSVAETELFRDPEGGRQLLQRLESENARLEAALVWWRQELVFWKWMAGGWGPEWTAVQRASQEAVGRELATLQRAWEQGEALAQTHGPRRLVKRDAGASGGPGLRAAELIGVLRSRETCLEAVLGRLQTRCWQELTRLAGARPGLLWILPPGR
ncbi:tubulin epsilon and delta complex protein 1 isoform X2 [Zalophus californianus]|uniref:Tubulin epsilon and delta complex protein 1 isoform X2 n=1 Tax=Zalophus californianus TaxID=9704 RepID=A0A6J2B8X6_ZALCA|nr:tubulin epsilon and delta complex protein 1 isoform X2 [Zalophus californianus]